jgi:hypothetical protein
MTPVSAEAFRRVEAILTALARRRGCRTEATREPAQTEGAVARLGARRLRCEGAAVELEAFVDLGECTVVAGEARHTPGQVGLRVHQRR